MGIGPGGNSAGAMLAACGFRSKGFRLLHLEPRVGNYKARLLILGVLQWERADMDNSGGRFVWYELATTDIEAAKAFYAGVVGWSTVDTAAGDAGYTLFIAGTAPAAGLTKLPPEALRTGALAQWNGYVGVEDVDAAAARVKQLGGSVYIPPTDIPNVSRFSVVADPQMATLVLVKGRERNQDESGQPGMPGRIAWHELLTSDLDKAFAFYSALFGWKKTHARSGPEGIYQNFAIGTETVGGISLKPDDWPRPLWFYYINVAGIEAAAKRVRSHGGKVLDGPAAVPGGAWVLHCRDPQGVPFSLIDTRVNVTVGCYAPRGREGKQAG
jgi:predicted enzyme related to lactoylglutathione lyase